MIKPWIIGTNIESYYTSFLRNFVDKYNPLEIRVENLGVNKYTIVDENENTMEEVFSETKIKQFLRVLSFTGLVEPSVRFNLVKSTIASHMKYKVLINKDYLDNKMELDWKEMMAQKIVKDLRLEFVKNKFSEVALPTQNNFLYAIAFTLISEGDKIAEDHLNLMLDGTKIKQFNKYYKQICSFINAFDVDIKHEIRKVLLGDIDTLKEIMDKRNNDVVPIDMHVDRETKLEVNTDILTFGKFLKKGMTDTNKIKIPIYQREYRWEWGTLVNLLIDIKNIKGNNIHNIGTIVTIDEKKSAYDAWWKIIDGQQRITSLSIILRSLYDLCVAKKWPIPSAIIELFSEKIDGFNYYSDRFVKIKGNKDFDAFQEMINGNHQNPELSKTKVSANFMSTLQWLSINIKDAKNAEEFWQRLLNGILFIVITDSNSNEYRLFEKLNTGSINLNTMELFKNHLLNKFEKVVDQNEEEFQSIFTNKILEKFKKKEELDTKKIDTFILTILRLNGEETNQNSLFEQYKNFVDVRYMEEDVIYSSAAQFKTVVNRISEDIDLFDNVTDSNIFTVRHSRMYPIADFLKVLEKRTVYAPLIMKLIKIHGDGLKSKNISQINELRKYLRAIETFEVRFQVVSYRGQSLSEKMAYVTRELDENTSPEELFRLLTTNKDSENSGSLSIQNEEVFERTLLNAQLQNKIASIISLRIENYIKFNGFEYEKEAEFVGFYNKISREHILPQKYKTNWEKDLKEWTQLTEEQISDQVERTNDLIGNAIIAPNWKNSIWGNLSFGDKHEKYTVNEVIPSLALFHGYSIKDNNKEDIVLEGINSDTLFTPELIEERTKSIAKLARIIWKDVK